MTKTPHGVKKWTCCLCDDYRDEDEKSQESGDEDEKSTNTGASFNEDTGGGGGDLSSLLVGAEEQKKEGRSIQSPTKSMSKREQMMEMKSKSRSSRSKWNLFTSINFGMGGSSLNKGLKPVSDYYKFVYGDVRPSVADKDSVLIKIAELRRRNFKTEETPDRLVSINEKRQQIQTNPSTLSQQVTSAVPQSRNNVGKNKKNKKAARKSYPEIFRWVASPTVQNIADRISERIKNRRTITVFLSSPFDGMEEERRLLREKYGTELEEMCAKKGYMLKFIDMRFGITSEMSNHHETVQTCLRGIDHSDIFLGFFGARYGSSTLLRKPLSSGTVEGNVTNNSIQVPYGVTSAEVMQFEMGNRTVLTFNNDVEQEYQIISFDQKSRTITIDGHFFNVPKNGSAYTISSCNGDWVLQDIENASKEFPFLEGDQGWSVTEMEYQHGLYQDHAHTLIGSGTIGTLPTKIEIPKTLKQLVKMARNAGKNIQLRLDNINKDSVRAGMCVRIEGEEMQLVIAWDKEALVATIKPGFTDRIEEGTEYKITVPSCLCVSLFRSPKYDQEKRDRAEKLIEETNSEEEQKKLEAQIRSFSSENNASAASLRELKAKWKKYAEVKQSLTFDNYKEPKNASHFMFIFLKEILKIILPKVKQTNRAMLVHQAFASARTMLELVGRDSVMEEIREYLVSDETKSPLLVTGKPGGGKSSILAFFCMDSNGFNVRDFKFVYHFVGCSKASTLLPQLVSRIVSEFDSMLEWDVETRKEYINLSTQKKLFWLIKKLETSHTEDTFIIVIDALNQIENSSYDGSSYLAHDLKWLPKDLPTNVKMLLSTLDGRCYNALHPHIDKELIVAPFNETERKQVIKKSLEFHSKNIDENWEPMWKCEQASNPMFLTLCIKELITSGTWKSLKDQIERLAQAETIVELIELVFERMEKMLDIVEGKNIQFVGNCMRLLWCSREGLSEAELMRMINVDLANNPKLDIQLEPRQWLTLCFGLNMLLVERAGLYTFGHDFVRMAVEKRYLTYDTCAASVADVKSSGNLQDVEKIQKRLHDLHDTLGSYFKVQSTDKTTTDLYTNLQDEEIPRSMREMDYHLQLAGLQPPVRVAVRLRPFLDFEQSGGGKDRSVVKMKGQQVIIVHPKTHQPHSFTVDFALNSCGNDIDYDGLKPLDTQDTVWNTCGVDVVEKAVAGFDVSLVAYGQTGSGKTYTMFGENGVDKDEGLIWTTCRELLRQLNENKTQKSIIFSVHVTIVEIYNNQVQDLLDERKMKPLLEGDNGVIVKGIRKKHVTNWEQIAEMMKHANKMRAVSSTRMNQESSRSHCVVSLWIEQSFEDKIGKELSKCSSKINLVDLAGSESGKTRKAVKPDEARKVLEEGIAINSSLSALNKCIRALADKKSTTNTKHIPYRDSKLTHLLKDSLGGKGKLILLAALSPAPSNYTETLSTLNYAKMAKLIENTAVSNAEKQFMAEVQKNASEQITLVSKDKMKFLVPKSSAQRTPFGSTMMADFLEQSTSSRIEISVPKTPGKVLQVVANYLRRMADVGHLDEERAKELDNEFITRFEKEWNVFPDCTNRGIKDLLLGIITSSDMGIESLCRLFQASLSRSLPRDPTLKEFDTFLEPVSGGLTTEQRLAKSQEHIDKYKGKTVKMYGRGGTFYNKEGVLQVGYRQAQAPLQWICENPAHGKCSFKNKMDGNYITAYGTGPLFEAHTRKELLKIGKNISPDLVDDVIKQVLLEDEEETDRTFNHSALTVEISSSSGPSNNQLFEIHDSTSPSDVMILTFCGTCLRSPDWSSNVEYSTYTVGEANLDEQISIYEVDEDEDSYY